MQLNIHYCHLKLNVLPIEFWERKELKTLNLLYYPTTLYHDEFQKWRPMDRRPVGDRMYVFSPYRRRDC